MAKISTVQSISESRRAQFKQGALKKKAGPANNPINSPQPVRIDKDKTPSTIQKRRLNIAAFQQKIKTALKSPPQRKATVDTARNIRNTRPKSFVNPISANRTLNRTSKVNSLISRNRFSISNTGSSQIRPRLKSLDQSEDKNQIKIPDTPQSAFKASRINLLA